jgi:hypothetical protein
MSSQETDVWGFLEKRRRRKRRRRRISSYSMIP